MKSLKKIMALALAMVMMVAMAIPAMAAAGDYTITIDNAVKGETYSAYKVFDVTYADAVDPVPSITPATAIPGTADNTHFNSAYAYTINSSSSMFWTDLITGVTADADGVYSLTTYGLKFVPTTTANTYNVLPIDSTNGVTDAQAQALAAFLATKLTGKTASASAAATAGTKGEEDDYALGTLTLDVSDAGAGYYFVDTTTGSLCSLNTTEPNAVIREKNSIPSETKEVSDAANGTFGEDATIKVGDTAYFKIEVTDSKGTDKKVVVHDTMDNALTLDLASFAVKVDDADVAVANYTIKVNSATTVPKKGTNSATNFSQATISDGCTFEIEFTDSFIQGLEENKKIVITYEAELNQNAVTADPFPVNKTHIEYSEQNTVEKDVTVKTYEGDLVKTDSDHKVLDGATFKMYDAATGGTEYQLVMVGTATAPATTTGVYMIKSSEVTGTAVEKLIPLNGKLTIKGLENGSYYFEEVDVPTGYNGLTERAVLTIENANNSATINSGTYASGGVEVVNQSGAELPSTGGIGTTIFYVIGAILVLGAGILLVTRRRMNAN